MTEPRNANDEPTTAAEITGDGAADSKEGTDSASDVEASTADSSELTALNEPIEQILEAILFAAERTLELPDIVEVFEKAGHVGIRTDTVHAGLQRLGERLTNTGSALSLIRVGGGWELRTRSRFAHWVTQLYEKRPIRLSRASLEVIAIVAYKQPCTRAVVDDIRGVDSSSTLRQMMKIGVLKMLGRADDVGRPIVYGTSNEFLRIFGLQQLSDLPTLREFAELSEEHMLTLAEFETSKSDDENGGTDAEADRPAIDASYQGRDFETFEKNDEVSDS